MKALVLGGTHFLGRHVVEALLARHHQVTLFNRGKTNPQVFPHVEQIHGNRDGGLDALHGRTFDVVIDTSGYVPRVVRQSVEALAPQASRYLFISSISVYRDFDHPQMTEEYPVGQLNNPADEDIPHDYGPLKAACEREVIQGFGDHALIVRPGLIVGPYDPTDRFTYWVRRFAQGGPVLVPGDPQRSVQWIDARDLASWMVDLLEHGTAGIYHATGPVPPITMGTLVSTLQQALPKASPLSTPVWVTEEFLHDHGVEEWSDLPLWIAERSGWPGFLTVNVDRALAEGLRFRPLTETIQDTWTWDQSRGLPSLVTGLSRDNETSLIRDWQASC